MKKKHQSNPKRVARNAKDDHLHMLLASRSGLHTQTAWLLQIQAAGGITIASRQLEA